MSVRARVRVCLTPFSPVLLSDPHRHSQDDSRVFGAAAKGHRGKVGRSRDDRRSTLLGGREGGLGGRAACFGRLGSARLQLPSLVRLSPPPNPTPDESARLPRVALKWRERGPSQTHRRPADMLVHANPPWTASAVHFRAAPPLPQPSCVPLQSGMGSTNCCSESVPVHIAVIRANLPVASVSVFFSLSPSLCRFTLTYRELILLFLSFNKLLSKR